MSTCLKRKSTILPLAVLKTIPPLILLAALCIYLLGYVVILRRQINTQNQSAQVVLDKIQDNDNKYITLVEHTDLAYKAMAVTKKINLKSFLTPLTKGLPTLILRVHSNDCNECVKYSLKMLTKMQASKKLNVILLADYKNNNAVINDFGQVNFPIVLQKQMPSDLDKVTKPYFFVYSNDKISQVFFPNYKFMEVCENYLNVIL